MASTMDSNASVETDIASSPREVVFHGDLTEFRDQLRCESCSNENLKCIIQRGEESCMLCNYAGRPCVFERKIQLRGSALRSQWDTLVNSVGSQFDVRYQSHFPTHSALRGTNFNPTNDADGPRRPRLPQYFGQIPSDLLSNNATDVGFSSKVARPYPPRLPPPPGDDDGITFVHERRRIRRKKGALNGDNVLHAAKVRRLGACQECREKKVKCVHILHDDRRGIRSDSPPVSRSSLECPTTADEDVAKSLSSSPRAPTSASKTTSDASVQPRADVKARDLNRQAYRPRRLICPIANCGRDFRGEHELTRHCERVHTDQRAVWVCNDISEGKKALAGCKSCEAGKQYNVDYNAVQHLRRCHVAVKPQASANGDSAETVSSENKRLIEVPNDSMEELRKWLRKEWIRNELFGEPDKLVTKRGTFRLATEVCAEESGNASRIITRNAEEDWENHLEESFAPHPQQDAEWQKLPGNSYEPTHSQPIELH